MSVVQKAREFSGEMLRNSAGNLSCSACREEFSLKLSTVKNHMESAKHKAQLKEKRSREQDIVRAFQVYVCAEGSPCW